MNERAELTTRERLTTTFPTLLSLGYLVAVLVGILFNYFKYSWFSINVFQYASVFDFLISPFEDPYILLFILGSLVLVGVSMWADRLWRLHFPVSYERWSFSFTRRSWYRPLSLALVSLAYVFYAAIFYGSYAYGQTLHQPDVTLQYMDGQVLQGKQIGKVGDAFFLLTGDTVRIVPLTTTVKSVSFPLE